MGLIENHKKEGRPLRYIVLKARQMGLSTLFEGLIYKDTSTNENKNSLIIAHEEQASSNLFQMSKLYYENSPEAIRPMKKYANGKVLSFENPTGDDNEKLKNPGRRSKIAIATAGAGEVGRSATYHNIHASEVAFFMRQPIFGVGVAMGAKLRGDEDGRAVLSHNELTRMLAEHGSLGILAMVILLFTPLILYLDNGNNLYIFCFLAFWLLTINHAAMRLAVPGFIYALALLKVVKPDENPALYRK